MSVTIKQIADACGMSRGTVDRVINGRGNVKPETEKLIRLTAESLGYRPNLAGKALARRKQNLKVGVLLVSENNPFFDEVIRGVTQAQTEINDYGVSLVLKTMRGYDANRQLELIEELEQECAVLVLHPVDHPSIAQKVEELKEKGIETVFVNTEIKGCGRLCYVGSNCRKGGETACGMLAMITGGKAMVGIVGGSNSILGHRQRVEGFCEVAKTRYPGLQIAALSHNEDDDEIAYQVTRKMLCDHPQINALFLAAAGVKGVCDAVLEQRKAGQISIVCFDGTPVASEMMKRGVIQAAVCQHPFTQGYKAVHTAFRYLVSGVRPPRDQMLVKNEIKIKENLQ